MNKYKRILVAVDLSPAADEIMLTALELGRALQSELHVIYVDKMNPVMPGRGGRGGEHGSVVPQEKLEKSLQDFASHYSGAGVKMTTAVRQGDPYMEIINAADEIGANMIIMGTHGRTGVAYLVLGSVAENVLRHAKVPVLSIRYLRK